MATPRKPRERTAFDPRDERSGWRKEQPNDRRHEQRNERRNPKVHEPGRGNMALGCGVFLFVAAILGAVAYFVAPIVLRSFEQSSLRESGTPAPALILAVRETNTRINERPVFDVDLEVRAEGMEPYKTTVSQPFSMLHAANLRPGGGAQVNYDPQNPQSVVITATGGLPPGSATDQASSTPESAKLDPLCEKAAKCCALIVGTEGATNCAGFKSPVMPPEACKSALEGYELAAKVRGLTCE